MQRIFIISLFIFLAACSQQRPFIWPASTQHIVELAEENAFERQEYNTQYFRLTTFEKHLPLAVDIFHVYIEGDGNSWKSKYVLSDNPTPKQPLALQLAYHDTHPHVIYIARPCQYTPHEQDKHCHPKYWSSHRYAPEVVASINEVLDDLKAHSTHPATYFYLIGFSGGASIAALVASKRNDVKCLSTVAGDLNHQALSQHHHTTPLTGSLNPMDVTAQLKYLPQRHFNGENDKIIPPWIATQFVQAINNPDCAKVHTFKDASHHKGWLEHSEEIAQFCSSAPTFILSQHQILHLSKREYRLLMNTHQG